MHATKRSGKSAESRLRERGIELPRPPLPRGRYVPGKVAGNLLFISGAYPTRPDEGGARDTLPYRGQLGGDLNVEQGRAAARLVAINLLAMARAVVGDLDRVRAVVRLTGYVNAAPGFMEAPAVLDGASSLLVDLFGPDAGAHARTALYQQGLPEDAPLTAELVLDLENNQEVAAEMTLNTRVQRIGVRDRNQGPGSGTSLRSDGQRVHTVAA
jgi:enamine deaminase RidA (YjgF/YER057c/UK114 family)